MITKIIRWWREITWRCPWCGNSADRPKLLQYQDMLKTGEILRSYKSSCNFPRHVDHYPQLYTANGDPK